MSVDNCFNATSSSSSQSSSLNTNNPPLGNGSRLMMTSAFPNDSAFGSEGRSGDDAQGAYVKFLFMEILIPVVCGLGLVGNLLSLVVLTTEKMHRTLTKMEISAHIGLIALAVSDFLFCLLVLIFTQVHHPSYFEPGDAMIYFELLSNGTITIFIIFSTWLIVVMAAERYIAVCHPLRARKLISLRRTRAVIAVVFVVCLLATIPIFLERSIEEVTCHDGRKLLELRGRSQESQKLRRILWAVFFDFIPCIALIYFNMCLIIQIRKAKKLRGGLAPTHYTFQASNKSVSRPAASTTRGSVYKNNINGDHAMSNALLKSSHNKHHHLHNNHKHDSETSGVGTAATNKANGGAKVKGRAEGQDRYTRLTVGGRSAVNYHSSHSSEDSAYPPSTQHINNHHNNTHHHHNQTSNSNNSPPRKKMTAKRMITTNGGSHHHGGVVKKRPSDSALNSVTATLVAVVLLFLILVSPSELLKFSLSYTESDQSAIVTSVTNFMQVLNFSLNFVLYCAVNKTFRQTLRGLACCCWLSITG